MIDIVKAQEAFKEYIKQYDESTDKVALKIKHTYNVVDTSEYVAKKLNLDEENVNLARLIALLHDIGRFEQLKKFDSYDDISTMDHGEYGVQVLFEDKLIRNFIETDKYDSIIYKAILNHNKYKIDEKDLNEVELLHSRIIRDSDKIDNFRVKKNESFEALFGISESEFVKQKITDRVYDDFFKCKLIYIKDNKTDMDRWISYLAFIFDYNFIESFKYIKEKDYINRIIDRVEYKDEDTKIKMQKIKQFANSYIDSNINKA